MAINPNDLAGTARLTFADEFNTLSLWAGPGSTGTWATQYWYDDDWGLWQTSNGGNLAGSVGSQEWYINANYAPTSSVKPWTVANGVLTITAAPASPDIQKLIDGFKYTSGEINSYRSFAQQYGYFEMRAQLPAGQGLWPAFWLLPLDHSWPPEIDIFEVLGNATTQLVVTAHSNATGSHTQVGTAVTVADMSKGFHTFGMDWQPDFISWWFDGVKVFQTPTPADMHKPMYIQANLGVGGWWPGMADSTTPFPAKMMIDYIRVYEAKATATPSSPPPPASVASLPDSGAWTRTISGGSGNDTIVGTAGNDLMAGGVGNDRMSGGKGDDTYNVGASGDVVVEASGEGIDTVQSWIASYTLPGNVENLRLSGSAAQTGIGNSLNNKLTSNDYASTLRGEGGNDVLIAGKGAGTLTGGAGEDIFVLAAGTTKSTRISDFTIEDTLDLRKLFAAAGYKGADPVADKYLAFSQSGSGVAVMFDKDGAGAAGPVQVAFLDNIVPTALKAQDDWVFV